eukprot:scaffold101459_cov60-Phaeocystis_antarctica.AAC.2
MPLLRQAGGAAGRRCHANPNPNPDPTPNPNPNQGGWSCRAAGRRCASTWSVTASCAGRRAE